MKKGKQKSAEPPKVFLTPAEAKAVQMALGMVIHDISKAAANEKLPWNADSRKDMKEILTAARSAGMKIQKITGVEAKTAEYIPAEEKDYFTKES